MKRGISPIVSVILVIALGIVLFLLVSNWIQKDILKDSLEKTEEKIEMQIDCNNFRVDIADACVDNLENAAKIKMNLDVAGDNDVKSITIKIIGKEDAATIDYEADSAVSAPNRLLNYKNELSLSKNIENAEKIEVYPKTDKGEICINQVESITRINACL